MSPIGPRVPAVEAHPTAMPPDTESDEEHKATKAYPESPGEHARTHTHTHTHTHTQQEAGKHKCRHKAEPAHQPDMYSAHMNRQADR